MRRIERGHVKAPRSAKGQQDGTWFVSYGDVITLLLGFLILFFFLEPPKKANTLLADSLIKEFRSIEQSGDPFKGGSRIAKDKKAGPSTQEGMALQARNGPVVSDQKAAWQKKSGITENHSIETNEPDRAVVRSPDQEGGRAAEQADQLAGKPDSELDEGSLEESAG
jgi:hypothetical protein